MTRKATTEDALKAIGKYIAEADKREKDRDNEIKALKEKVDRLSATNQGGNPSGNSAN